MSNEFWLTNEGFFNIRALTDKYNADIYMIMGGRRIGKTYSIRQKLVEDYENDYHKFTYIARYKTHLKGRVIDFFSKFNREGWKATPKYMLYNKQIAGYNIALTEDETKKGIDYSGVVSYFFDEFLTKAFYPADEVQSLINLIFTQSDYLENETNKKELILASNSVSKDNPYFSYFGIRKLPEQNKPMVFMKFGLKIVILILPVSDILLNKAKNSLAFRLAKFDDKYYNYAIKADFSFDDDKMIDMNFKKKELSHQIILCGLVISVWKGLNRLIYFEQSERKSQYCYPLTRSDALLNNIKYRETPSLLSMYKEKLNAGNVRFSSYELREVVIEWLAKN